MEPDADAKGASGANSGTASSFTARFMGRSSPPVQDHLIHLLAQRLHVGIGKASVQRAHVVGVVAGLAQRVELSIVEVGLADLAGLAGGSGRTVIAAWDADGEADVAAIKADADRGRFTRIQGVHRIDDGIGKGWALITLWAGSAIAAVGSGLALDAVIAAWDVEGEVQGVSSHTHGGIRGGAGFHGVHAVHLGGGEGEDGINDGFQPVELAAHLHGIQRRAFLGEIGVEHRLGDLEMGRLGEAGRKGHRWVLDVDRSSVGFERESVGVGVGSVSTDWRRVGGDR